MLLQYARAWTRRRYRTLDNKFALYTDVQGEVLGGWRSYLSTYYQTRINSNGMSYDNSFFAGHFIFLEPVRLK